MFGRHVRAIGIGDRRAKGTHPRAKRRKLGKSRGRVDNEGFCSRRLHLRRDILPNAQRERLEAVARRRRSRRRRADEVAELRLLSARLNSESHHGNTAGRACIFNGLDRRPGSKHRLVRAVAGLVACLVAREAEPLVLLAFRLPAFLRTVSFAVAIDRCHVRTPTRRHHPGGTIFKLRLSTSSRSTLEPASCATPCWSEPSCLHKG